MRINKLRTVFYEYESPWSIIENIKWSNYVNTRQFLNAFGSEAAANTGNIISKIYLNLWTLEGIDDQKFKLAFGESLSAHNETIYNKLTQMLPLNLRAKSLFKDHLNFCSECIKAGHHSIFHQFKMTEICPYHMIELENVCPSCKQPIPYSMPNHSFETGFVCSCGEFLGTSQDLYVSSAEFKIKDPDIVNWLSISDENIQNLRNTIVFKPFLNQGPKLMNSLLRVIQNTTTPDKVHSVFNTHSCFPKTSLENEYKHFYNSLESTLEGYENFLLKTVMKDHKHCLKRFVGMYKKPGEDFPAICPYAYAYAFWKGSFFNINPFIDQYKKTPFFNKRVAPYELPFHYMNEEFRELLISYRSCNLRTLFWMFNHLLWEIAESHFQLWLGIATDNAQIKIKPMLDGLNKNPSIVLFSQREHRLEKFVFTKLKTDSPPCPYNKKSIIFNDEISFLPMRLAINDGKNEEKKAAENYLRRLRSYL